MIAVGKRSDRKGAMGTETLWQFTVCEQISTILAQQASIKALWLGGSLARNEADIVSDIDLVALAADATVDEAAASVENLLAASFSLVLVRNRGDDQHRLLNFVTDKWVRFDLNVFTLEAIRQSKFGGLRPLFDKDGLDLPVSGGEPPTRDVSGEQVYFVVSEFMRVLGLLPVVMHRRDFVGAVTGSGLLREHLVTLLQYEQRGQTRTGALNDIKSLTSAATSAILGLPALRAEDSAILEFNRACWDVFSEYGPRICQQYGVEWPTELAEALRSRLARDLSMTIG